MPKRVVKRYVEYESSEEEEEVAAPQESESSEEEVIIRRKKKRTPAPPKPVEAEPETKDYSIDELCSLAKKHFEGVYASELRKGNGIKKKNHPKNMGLYLKIRNNLTNKENYDLVVASKDTSIANFQALSSTKTKLENLGYMCEFRVPLN